MLRIGQLTAFIAVGTDNSSAAHGIVRVEHLQKGYRDGVICLPAVISTAHFFLNSASSFIGAKRTLSPRALPIPIKVRPLGLISKFR